MIQPPVIFGSASDSGYTDEVLTTFRKIILTRGPFQMVYVAVAMLATNTIASLGVIVVRFVNNFQSDEF